MGIELKLPPLDIVRENRGSVCCWVWVCFVVVVVVVSVFFVVDVVFFGGSNFRGKWLKLHFLMFCV